MQKNILIAMAFLFSQELSYSASFDVGSAQEDSDASSSTRIVKIPSQSTGNLWDNEADFLVFMGEITTKHIVRHVDLPLLQKLFLNSKSSGTKEMSLDFSPRKSPARSLFTDMESLYDGFSYLPDYEKRFLGTKVKEENPILHLYIQPLLTPTEDVLKRRLEIFIDSVVNSHIKTRQIHQVNLYFSYPFETLAYGLEEFHTFFKCMSLLPTYLNREEVADYISVDSSFAHFPTYRLNLIIDFPDRTRKEMNVYEFFSTFNRTFLKNKGNLDVTGYNDIHANFDQHQRGIWQSGKHFTHLLTEWDDTQDELSYPGPTRIDISKTNLSGIRATLSIPFPLPRDIKIPFEPRPLAGFLRPNPSPSKKAQKPDSVPLPPQSSIARKGFEDPSLKGKPSVKDLAGKLGNIL